MLVELAIGRSPCPPSFYSMGQPAFLDFERARSDLLPTLLGSLPNLKPKTYLAYIPYGILNAN